MGPILDKPAPLNEKRHRDARKAAGITSCVKCRDTGEITHYVGSGRRGMIGCYTYTDVCLDCGLDELLENKELKEALEKLLT